MNWISLRLAAANVTRRKLRSFVTVMGVAGASACLFTLVSFQRGYRSGLSEELTRLGAHLLVVPKGCPYDAASIALHGASWPCYLSEESLGVVRQVEHVRAVAPVFMSAIYLSGSGKQVVYCGVDPEILNLKSLWKLRGRFPSQRNDLLAGAEIAREYGWRIGQTLALPGLNGERGRITGILEPTEGADDLFLFLPIKDAQRVFRQPDKITHMLVQADDVANVGALERGLRGCSAGMDTNVVPLSHLLKTVLRLVESTRMLLLGAALIGLIAMAAGVSNTVLMSVVERTREIGVLRALGASKALILRVVWAEALVLCLAGSAIGIVSAALCSALTEQWLRSRLPFAPHGRLMQPEMDLAVICTAVVLGIGLLASVFPAVQAATLSPSITIRSRGSAA